MVLGAKKSEVNYSDWSAVLDAFIWNRNPERSCALLMMNSERNEKKSGLDTQERHQKPILGNPLGSRRSNPVCGREF